MAGVTWEQIEHAGEKDAAWICAGLRFPLPACRGCALSAEQPQEAR